MLTAAITVEMITIIIAIVGPLLVGAFAVWRMVEKKLKEGLSMLEREHSRLDDRIKNLEKTAITKEDYQADRESFNRALESMALSLREGLATVTGRIDLVLFEIGRRERDGK